MKPLIPIVVTVGLALVSLPSQAADSHPLQPNAPRTVTVSEADTPPVTCPHRSGFNTSLFADVQGDQCKLCGIWATASLFCWLRPAARPA